MTIAHYYINRQSSQCCNFGWFLEQISCNMGACDFITWYVSISSQFCSPQSSGNTATYISDISVMLMLQLLFVTQAIRVCLMCMDKPDYMSKDIIKSWLHMLQMLCNPSSTPKLCANLLIHLLSLSYSWLD